MVYCNDHTCKGAKFLNWKSGIAFHEFADSVYTWNMIHTFRNDKALRKRSHCNAWVKLFQLRIFWSRTKYVNAGVFTKNLSWKVASCNFSVLCGLSVYCKVDNCISSYIICKPSFEKCVMYANCEVHVVHVAKLLTYNGVSAKVDCDIFLYLRTSY